MTTARVCHRCDEEIPREAKGWFGFGVWICEPCLASEPEARRGRFMKAVRAAQDSRRPCPPGGGESVDAMIRRLQALGRAAREYERAMKFFVEPLQVVAVREALAACERHGDLDDAGPREGASILPRPEEP